MRNLVGSSIPEALAQRVLDAAAALREGRLGEKDMGPVVDVVAEMSDVVMRHFFLQPSRDFGLGPALRAVVELSVASSSKTVQYGLKKVLPKLNDAQRRQLGVFLESSLYEPGKSGG